MARWKWTPKRRAAFKRMRAAAARRASRTNPRRRRRARRRNSADVNQVTNPRRRRRNAAGMGGRILALLPIGGRSMAKSKKRRGKRRRRRNPGALLVNPSRRRRSRRRRTNPSRRRRRRNPGFGGYAKQGLRDIMMAAIPATLGGIVIGFVDSKFLGTAGTIGRNVGKLLTAVVVAALARKKLGPVGTGVALGAVLGTIGHEVGVRLGGGMVTMTKREGVKELVEMAATDAETQAELGALIEGEDEISAEEESADIYTRAIEGGAQKTGYESAFDDEDA